MKTKRTPVEVASIRFSLIRNGTTPCVTFDPGDIGGVENLTRIERRELVRHVRSILRDRSN